MKEMIIRISETKNDVDVLTVNSKKQEIFSSLSKEKFMDILTSEFVINDESNLHKSMTFCDDRIIAFNGNEILIKQDDHKRVVLYNNKAYKISFPNSLYLLCHSGDKIVYICAYCFKEYKGLQTDLYRYPMPNMLHSNRICMGSADTRIQNKDFFQALENVIYAEYTHNTFSDLKSFKNTEEYFNYLTENEFPYNYLIPLNINLANIIYGKSSSIV